MRGVRWAAAVPALALAVWLAAPAPSQAGKTYLAVSPGYRSSGARADITVPYTTDGYSTRMHGVVAPKVYASPVVDDPKRPQSKPVFNLIFYGAKQSFGDRSNGATPRPK
ncbi:MAG TPA: hypothetical protein VFA26_01400 [Gemmataceae bacterium]|nr:hypothetical protein [Gemmataceae bacterium]